MVFLKKLKPTSPGQRHSLIFNSFFFPRFKKIKAFSLRVKNHVGKCSQGGHLLTYKKGKRKHKLFKKGCFSHIKGMVLTIERLSYRKFVCRCLCFRSKKFFYYPYTSGLGPGSLIRFMSNNSKANSNKLGCVTSFFSVHAGRFVNHLNCFSSKGFLIGCASGSSIAVLNRTTLFSLVRLPSGISFKYSLDTLCLSGVPGLKSFKQVVYGKAGRACNLGKKPIVRGVAMNPVDHPHGGGEGKTSGGRPSTTPWGRPVHRGKIKKGWV